MTGFMRGENYFEWRTANKKAGICAGLFHVSSENAVSVFSGDRPTPAEAIVHAHLDGVLVVAEARAGNRGRAGEGGVAEIVVLVLGLGRPVRREHVFEAGADGPAVLVGAVGGEGDRSTGDANPDIGIVAPGVTALGVEQSGAPGVAGAAGDRAELVAIGRDQAATRKRHAGVVAVHPAILGFDAHHAIGRELVVEAALHAADEAGVAASEVVVAGKSAADMAADIEAGPVVDHR